MRFDVLTIFPGLFQGFLGESLLHKALQRQLLEIHLWNFRDWATDKHQSVDDRPYGGGPGMLLSCDPIFRCVEEVRQQGSSPGQLIMLTPNGRRLDQQLVEQLSEQERLILLCGRYEGFDHRIVEGLQPLEISIGDFICNGGEVPAMIIIEAVMRLIPGLLGDEDSARLDSFSDPGQVEYPQYTRPRDYRGMQVPDVLLSGNHAEVERWRNEQSLERTRRRQDDQAASNRESSSDSE